MAVGEDPETPQVVCVLVSYAYVCTTNRRVLPKKVPRQLEIQARHHVLLEQHPFRLLMVTEALASSKATNQSLKLQGAMLAHATLC